MKLPLSRSTVSLPEVHSSVATSKQSMVRRMFAFAGPAYLVSVGYMDPGNWATDLEGGARFGYQLLWVLVMSNLMAILLQTLSARLGIVSGRDLAQACRECYPRPVNLVLWGLCEIAIAACDLAEVLGAAIGLNLLFGLPLMWGVILTAADTLLILWFTRFGIRIIEAFVLALIAIITGCFLVELWFAKPVLSQMASGLIPRLTDESLYVAIGILGATVMPHNLYLHSALVQTRKIGRTTQEKRAACRFNLVDSIVALNGALIVNAAILVLAASVFFTKGVVVTEIKQAHEMLAPLVGATLASILFAVALLCSGQSSTLTGTLAGQIVMEGFLNLRMQPWLRRLITRLIAIIPAVFTIQTSGEHGTYRLLILSQVILSMQLPFAIIPLIRFTSDRERMAEFTNRAWVRVLAWTAATLIVGLNVRLVFLTLDELLLPLSPVLVALGALVLYVTFGRFRRRAEAPVRELEPVVEAAPVYRRILVPLDHTARDREAIAHASAMASLHSAKLYLLHVEEGVTSRLFGAESATAEIQAGEEYFRRIMQDLEARGIEVEMMVAYKGTPREEIVKAARAIQPDMIVMGAHGHRGIKDLIYGTTINAVRHQVKVPILVVGGPK